MKTVALYLALGIPFGVSGQASISAVYTFGTTPEGDLAPITSGAYFAASDFGYQGDATSPEIIDEGNPGNAYDATHWDSPGDYFTFTIDPDSGYAFSGTSLAFDARVTDSGPQTLSLFSSHGGFENEIVSFTNTNGILFGTYEADITSIVTSASPVEFRIFGAGASFWSGKFQIDNVSLTGTISAVPEPATSAAITGLGVLGFSLWRRRLVASRRQAL